MPTPDLADLRRLLSRKPSTLLRATAPELCDALPLLDQLVGSHQALEQRVENLEAYLHPRSLGLER